MDENGNIREKGGVVDVKLFIIPECKTDVREGEIFLVNGPWFKCQHTNDVGKTLSCPVDPHDLHKPKNWINRSHFREHFHRCHRHHREKQLSFIANSSGPICTPGGLVTSQVNEE